MSAIDKAGELGRTTAKRGQKAYRILQIYCTKFQEWRKREKLRAKLYGLTENELTDIGITRSEIEYVASNRSMSPRFFALDL